MRMRGGLVSRHRRDVQVIFGTGMPTPRLLGEALRAQVLLYEASDLRIVEVGESKMRVPFYALLSQFQQSHMATQGIINQSISSCTFLLTERISPDSEGR